MKYYKFIATTPFLGTENKYCFCFNNNEANEELLNKYAENLRIENAKYYEYLIFDLKENYENKEDYYNDCACDYFEISEKEYNKLYD